MGRNRSFRRHIARARRRGHALHRMVGSTMGMSLALVAPNAWAQTPPSAEQKEGKDDVALPGVDVRSQRNQFKIEEPSLHKLPDPIKDTPQSITVIPEQVLDERAMFTLRDALRTVPGISLAAGEAGGRQGDNLTLRGFPAGNDIYIDGVRDLGQYSRATFNLGVGRGAQGPLLGPVRPRLHRRNHQPGQQDTEAHPVLRDQRHRRERTAGAGDPRLPGRDLVTSERWGVAPSFGIGLNGPTRLIVSYFYQGDDNLPDYGLPYFRGGPAKVNTENFYGFPKRDYEHDDVHIGTIRLEHDFNESIKFRSTLRFSLADRGSLASIPAIVGTPGSLPLTAIQVSRTGIQRSQVDTSVLGGPPTTSPRSGRWAGARSSWTSATPTPTTSTWCRRTCAAT